jgi:hypothetical protein
MSSNREAIFFFLSADYADIHRYFSALVTDVGVIVEQGKNSSLAVRRGARNP